MGRVWLFSLYVYRGGVSSSLGWFSMVYPPPPTPASKKMPNDCPPFDLVREGGRTGGGGGRRGVNETFFLSSEDYDKTKITHFKCATKITEYQQISKAELEITQFFKIFGCSISITLTGYAMKFFLPFNFTRCMETSTSADYIEASYSQECKNPFHLDQKLYTNPEKQKLMLPCTSLRHTKIS